MSTRSLICLKEGKGKYRTIYCHSDGYLEYNGALLLDIYNNREIINKLLDLGNLSSLNEKLYPDPTRPHSFDYEKRQDDVVVAYGRDRGETGEEAKTCSMKDLRDDNSWIEYVYIFDEDNKWKYLHYPLSTSELRDVEKDLDQIYQNYGFKERVPNYYGYLNDDIVAKLKKYQDRDGEME